MAETAPWDDPTTVQAASPASGGETAPWDDPTIKAPASEGALASAAEPVTSLPETYKGDVAGAIDQVKRGVKELGSGDLGDVASGLGSVALGGLGYVTAPINAPLQTFVEKPVEKLVSGLGGSPRLASALGAGAEAAAGFALPIPKVEREPLPAPPETPFGVTKSEGQTTGNLKALQREQAALRGGLGDPALEQAEAFKQQQQGQLATARQNIAAGMDHTQQQPPVRSAQEAADLISSAVNGQQVRIDNMVGLNERRLASNHNAFRAGLSPTNSVLAQSPLDAADIISGSVANEAERVQAAKNAAYDAANNMPGKFHPASFNKIDQEIHTQLGNQRNPTLINPQQHPLATGALSDLDDILSDLKQQRDPDTGRIIPKPPLTPERIEIARQRLNTYLTSALQSARANPSSWMDVGALRNVVDAFDDAVAKRYGDGRFTGGDSQAVVDAFANARKLNAQYRKTYTPQGPGDVVGQAVQRILGRYEGQAATPEEIQSMLYGKSGLPPKIAQRLSDIFGANSPEFGAAKQGFESYVTEPPAGGAAWDPEKIANRIDEFTKGPGRTLTQKYLSQPEITQWQNYAQQLRTHASAAEAAANPFEGMDFETVLRRGANGDQNALNAINQVRTRLGADHPASIAAKQGLFQRALQRVEGVPDSEWGPGKQADNLRRLVNKTRNSPLYTPEDRKVMGSYADLLESLDVPQPGANWSNTATFRQLLLHRMSGWLGTVVGAALARQVLPLPWWISEVVGGGMAASARRASEAIDARIIRRQMPLIADAAKRYQRVVRWNQNTPARAALVASTARDLNNALQPLGVQLKDFVEGAQSPGPASAQQPQQRAEGGAVNRPMGGPVEDDGPEPPTGTPNAFRAITQTPVLQMDPLAASMAQHGAAAGPGPMREPEATPAPTPEEPTPPLYSAVEKAVQAAPQNKASAEQWSGYLRNQPGVKPEELDWLGMPESTGPITKDQLLQHIGDNKLQLDEKELGGPNEYNPTTLVGPQEEEYYRNIESIARDGYGTNYDSLDPYDQEEVRHRAFAELGITPTKYSGYQMPGGDNYRELLLKMPQKSNPLTGDEQNFLAYARDQRSRDRQLSPAEAQQEEALLAKLRPYNQQEPFQSSHWPDDPNVLLHMRMNDRQIPGVGDSLHLEELQSDWMQQGRKKGFAQQRSPDEFTPVWNDEGWWDVKDNKTGQTHEVDPFIVTPTDPNAAKSAASVVAERVSKQGVPEAPFKTTWPELGLKRAIVQAAREGKDAISWTPGQQQADRYNLSQHVDRINWARHKDDGTYDIDVFGKGSEEGDRPDISRYSQTESQLADLIGKEAAEKIINDKGGEHFGQWAGHGALTGPDLKVGGEGMKGFYDKMLPSIANKIGKKYGAQVEWQDVPTGTSGKFQILDRYGRPKKFNTREEALEYAEDMDLPPSAVTQLGKTTTQYTKVPVLRLTPKLKEQATKNGLSMFARGGAVRGEQQAQSSTGTHPAMAMSGSVFARGGAKNGPAEEKVVGEGSGQENSSERNRASGGRVEAKNIDHNPTPAQAKAGNYAKDHVTVQGLPITIENAKGSTRRGVGKDGKVWESKLPSAYGYFKKSEGADGDHVDVYLGPHIKSPKVWIIDQFDADSRKFDEHKVFLGWASKQQAINTYLKSFSDNRGMDRLGAIHEMSVDDFKKWLADGNTTAPVKGHRIDRAAFHYQEPRPPHPEKHCEWCRYMSGKTAVGCGLYRMANQRMPEDFNLDPDVKPKAYCDAFIKAD